MRKNVIRLSKNDFDNIVFESVKRIISESELKRIIKEELANQLQINSVQSKFIIVDTFDLLKKVYEIFKENINALARPVVFNLLKSASKEFSKIKLPCTIDATFVQKNMPKLYGDIMRFTKNNERIANTFNSFKIDMRALNSNASNATVRLTPSGNINMKTTDVVATLAK